MVLKRQILHLINVDIQSLLENMESSTNDGSISQDEVLTLQENYDILLKSIMDY